MKHIITLLSILLVLFSCSKEDLQDTNDTNSNDSTQIDSTITTTDSAYLVVKMETPKGDIYLWLFDETPLHKERFLWLTNNGQFDDQTFNRIINNFVVQGGTDLDTVSNLDTTLEMSPYEKVDGLVHAFGALGAARLGDDVNPDRKDMGDQWYIVEEISAADSARLDTGYVIFGQVISDLEVVKALGRVEVNLSNSPVTPLYMQVDTITLTTAYIQDSLGFQLENLMIPH